MLRPQEKWAKNKVVQRMERVQAVRREEDAPHSATYMAPLLRVLPQQCEMDVVRYAIERCPYCPSIVLSIN